MNHDNQTSPQIDPSAPRVTAALGPSTFRTAEVITVTVNPSTTVADIAQLFATAGRQDEPLPGLVITGLKLSWTCRPTKGSTAPANPSPPPATPLLPTDQGGPA